MLNPQTVEIRRRPTCPGVDGAGCPKPATHEVWTHPGNRWNGVVYCSKHAQAHAKVIAAQYGVKIQGG